MKAIRLTEDAKNYRLVDEDGDVVVKRFTKKTWTKREVQVWRNGYLHGLAA